jgi:hypothetical protein
MTTGTGTGAMLIGVGSCIANDQCVSGVCGLNGTGNCCNAACSSAPPPCGATDCDGQTGVCVFPDAGVACGGLACAGDLLGHPSVCDGEGSCAPNTTNCAPYACEDAGCLTSCETSAQCAGGSFCDTLNVTCCSGLAAGGTVVADSARGYDSSACCGIGESRPCQTITQAMKLIDSAQARDVTIEAQVLFDGGLWEEAGPGIETYPIALGWGAELSAPGVTFLGNLTLISNPIPEIFDIKSYSSSDTVGYASITGAAGLPVALATSETAIQVETGSHLYIANADLNSYNGIYVLPLASLTLGQDHSDSVTGTVTIGVSPPPGLSAAGFVGLTCFSDDAGNGCTIDDAELGSGSSVIIQDQQYADIVAEDGASISLTSAPIVGVTPISPGFQGCPSKIDSSDSTCAVSLVGSATVLFKNGSVQCIHGEGFLLKPSNVGSPKLTIDNSVIQNTDIGIDVFAGSLTVANSTIRFNAGGVELFGDAGVDLSGGPLGGVNTIACNFGDVVSGSVLNHGLKPINASNVAWDTPGPSVFACSDDAGCVCVTSDCTVWDAGLVFDAISFGTSPEIITTGHTLSPLECE